MSDLISRNKLIQHLNDWALQEAPFRDMEHNLIYNAIQECIKAVEEQPIAYDKDRVVAQLENVSYLDDPWYSDERIKIIEEADAISIVQKGGIE